MGLVKAAISAASGVMADQWKEYFYCDALPADVLAVKGQKRTDRRSSNKHGSENIISDGSIVAVADGQCALIVEQGKVVELCAEPGEYTYSTGSQPSLLSGGLKNIDDAFAEVGKRIGFGGQAATDQRLYYINTKELVGNKYGTPSPVPFRVVDQNAGLDVDISVRCFGEYSYRITNPILFYTNLCGNVEQEYTRSEIDGQLKTELLTALQPAFARISDMGIRYSAVPAHTLELADALNDVLSAKWRDLRGIEIVSLGVSSIKASEEDEQMIKEMQRNAAFRDPTRAAAHLVGAQASAMQAAAANEGGATMGFMGMGMAGAAGGMNPQALFQMGQQQAAQPVQSAPAQPAPAAPAAPAQPAAPAGDSWTCACGNVATGKFCPECGAKKPEPPKASAEGAWTCPTCGASNKGKFCAECGTKKPAGVPQYKCDKCGWEPADPTKPPKFCPECGDPFDDGDIV